MGDKLVYMIDDAYSSPKFFYKAGVYCRVSSPTGAQLDSLEQQASDLTQFVSNHANWLYKDLYIDVAGGKHTQELKQYKRLLEDCKSGKIDLVVTRTVARFGRNVEESIRNIRELNGYGTTLCFMDEDFDHDMYDSTEYELMLTILSAVAEGENRSRSENIHWGIHRQLENGTSSIYSRPCYGYSKNEYGELIIIKDEADIVSEIFDLYLSGESILGIQKHLNSRFIKAPTGGHKWPKRTIQNILGNEKYCGNVLVIKTYTTPNPDKRRAKNRGENEQYLMVGHHPAIISKERFNAVQELKKRRSNIGEDGKRKAVKYSSKTAKDRQ